MDRYIAEESEDSKISLNSIKMEVSETPSPIPYANSAITSKQQFNLFDGNNSKNSPETSTSTLVKLEINELPSPTPSSSSESASEPLDGKISKDSPDLSTPTQLEINEVPSPTSSLNFANTSEPRLRLLDGTFFKFLPEDSTTNIVVALCIKCAPQKVKVRGYNNCSSNFLGHLKRKHGNECVNEYKEYVKIKHRKKWSHNNNEKRETRSGNIFNSTEILEGGKLLSQDQFDDNIVKYFIHSMIPLRVLEDPYFSQIFSVFNLQGIGVNLMNVQTLRHRIDEYYVREINDIKSQLNKIDYVCTSIDIWPGKKISFIGITAHWITNDLANVSMALACRRFKSFHTNDRISQLIQEINAEFGLTVTNVVATIVNNESNLIKAFKLFGVQLQNINMVCHKEDKTDTISSDSEEFEEEDHNILTLPNLDTMKISSLPVRLRCCGHTLILCATIDANMVLTDQNTLLSNIHKTVMQKCNALWKAAGEPESAKIIQDTLQQTLSRPEVTKWNSLFDSLQQILSIKEKNQQLHKALNLKNPISKSEFMYIREYLLCAEPITEALDIMQRENNRYYGIVLPCIFALRRKLKKIDRKHNFIYCKPLIKTYIGSVETRFSTFFDLNTPESETAAIAALSYPRFKNTWLSCLEPVQRNKVLNVFKTIISKQIQHKPETTINSIKTENTFFNFDSDSDSENVKMQPNTQPSAPLIKAELLVLNFFAEQCQELSILNSYPEIKHVFIKYNTALPSSAAVERLFSYDTMMNLLNSYRLSDEIFEKRVILKSNLSYKNL